MSRKQNKKQRERKVKKKNKSQKAAMRKAHFANGGTTNVWCGKSNAHQDRKKARNKKACRKKVQW